MTISAVSPGSQMSTRTRDGSPPPWGREGSSTSDRVTAQLAALRPRFEIIGIDFGANVARSIERHPFGSWRERDFDQADSPVPVSSEELVGSVLVCSDVIEHLRSPDILLRTLRGALEQASVLVLSTPERELWHGVRSLHPPRNPHHVREWSIRELGQLMRASGFDWISMGLTRSNDRTRRSIHHRSRRNP